MNEQIYIAADHNGFALKNEIINKLKDNYDLTDLGANTQSTVDDYTVFAARLAKRISAGISAKGILICRSGIGMSIMANKFPNVRAAIVNNQEEAIADIKEHNSNVLILSTNQVKSEGDAVAIITAWLKADFARGRHLRRVNQIRFQDESQRLLTTHPLIVPAPLSNSETDVKNQVSALQHIAPLISIDFMDNTLIPGNTISFESLLKVISKFNHLFAIHLMVKDPSKYLDQLQNHKNVYSVYIHAESSLGNIIEQEWSFQLGITYNPTTKIELQFIKKFPILMLMTVAPGAQGRPADMSQLQKLPEIRNSGFTGEIHIDGGANGVTLKEFLSYDLDLLNVGSAISKSADPISAYANLAKQILNNES